MTPRRQRARTAFYKDFLREGMIAFDIGSNVGDLAALFSKCVGRSGQVHCFEPGEMAFAKLGTLVSGLESSNVVLNRKAVGELVGKTQFHVYPEATTPGIPALADHSRITVSIWRPHKSRRWIAPPWMTIAPKPAFL